MHVHFHYIDLDFKAINSCTETPTQVGNRIIKKEVIAFCFFTAAPLRKPQLLFRGVSTTGLTWGATRPSNYLVQKWNNNTLSWENARCLESSVPGSCVVYSPWSTIAGLKPSTVYYFRIYVTDSVTSPSSEPIKTRTPRT